MLRVYADLVFVLNFLVDLMLLLGTNSLTGFPPAIGKCVQASLLGGAYAGVCVFPGMQFLGNALWRVVCLGLVAAIAFGIRKTTIRRGAVFVLLSMAMGGIAIAVGKGNMGVLLLCGLATLLLCRFGIRGRIGTQQFVPAELVWKDRRAQMMALVDTGNTLCDPVTGEPVSVVGPDIAENLLGLSIEQLRNPVQTMKSQPVLGLRLVPYHAVGKTEGMLLAFRFPRSKIGTSQGDYLIAFSPNSLSGEYQMLTGGVQ